MKNLSNNLKGASKGISMRRFMLFFLLSLAMHAFFFSLPPPLPKARWPMTQVLEVHLEASAKSAIKTQAEKPDARKTPSMSPAKRNHVAEVTTTPKDLIPQHAVETKQIAPSTSAPQKVSIATLLESARKLAREERGAPPPPSKETTTIFERPVLPQLARALRREVPGETRLANGMIKVVTTTGAIYCLQPLPKFAQGGPIEPMIVPTNCPS